MALYPRIPFSTLANVSPRILDSFYYPAAAGSRDDFLSYWQLEYGEFTPIYQEPSLLKEHIRVVAAAIKPTLDAWAEALAIEYAPLENYDRIEDGLDVRTPDLKENETTTHGRTETMTGGHGDTTTHGKAETTTGGHTNTTTHGKTETMSGGYKDATPPTHTTEHQVAADNTGTYYPAEKTIEDQNYTERTYNQQKSTEGGTTKDELVYNSEKRQESGTTSNAFTYNSEKKSEGGSTGVSSTQTGTEKNKHDLRVHGNIGVTTSQQMLQSEIDLRRFNFMEEAGRLYAEKLLIMLY